MGLQIIDTSDVTLSNLIHFYKSQFPQGCFEVYITYIEKVIASNV